MFRKLAQRAGISCAVKKVYVPSHITPYGGIIKLANVKKVTCSTLLQPKQSLDSSFQLTALLWDGQSADIIHIISLYILTSTTPSYSL